MQYKPGIGKIVHYVPQYGLINNKTFAPFSQETRICLAAIIVRVVNDTCVDLEVFCDGSNKDEVYLKTVKWRFEVKLDDSENPAMLTWHQPEWE
jgi:hypothetical protein